jgi:hypothetical protein
MRALPKQSQAKGVALFQGHHILELKNVPPQSLGMNVFWGFETFCWLWRGTNAWYKGSYVYTTNQRKKHQSRRERKGRTQREDLKHQSRRERKGGTQGEDQKHQSRRERKRGTQREDQKHQSRR